MILKPNINHDLSNSRLQWLSVQPCDITGAIRGADVEGTVDDNDNDMFLWDV